MMENVHKNSHRPQQVDYICQKGPTADVWLGSKGAPGFRVVVFFSFGIPKHPCFLIYNIQYVHLAHLNKGQSFTI